jgi:hypothetical protein
MRCRMSVRVYRLVTSPPLTDLIFLAQKLQRHCLTCTTPVQLPKETTNAKGRGPRTRWPPSPLPLRMLTEPSQEVGFDHEHNHQHLSQCQYPARIQTQTRAPTYQRRAAHEGMDDPPRLLTSQCCTAVSFDTCTAIARFLSQLRE